MLRIATIEDHDHILQMSMKFMERTEYNHLSDEESISNVIKTMINASNDQAIIIVHDHGFIAGLVSPFIFGKHKVATEVAWYVDDEHRENGLGQELLAAFEYWARQTGCDLITMVGLDDSVNKFYEKNEYSLRERAYMKELN